MVIIKKILILILVLYSLIAKNQVNNQIITINAQVVTELHEPLIAAIDRHLVVSKALKIKNTSEFFILVSIFPRINEWEIPKHDFDSIYAINDFKSVFPIDSVTPTYSVTIALASKKYFTQGWMGFGRKNVYYYKYKNYDVLINSELNLTFKNENEKKQFTQHLMIQDGPKKFTPYKILTGYSMWNRYLTEIRLKDIIWPQWTGKRDDF